MGILNKQKLLAKETLKIEKVDLGDGEFVCVRQMTGRERDRFEQSLIRETKNMQGKVEGYERSLDDFRAKLAVCTLCDEEGAALLEVKDYPTLSQNMSAYRLEKIVNVAQRLNKISEEDKEQLVKNSDAAQSGNSSSDSAESLE
jgi:hypothetical protein